MEGGYAAVAVVLYIQLYVQCCQDVHWIYSNARLYILPAAMYVGGAT